MMMLISFLALINAIFFHRRDWFNGIKKYISIWLFINVFLINFYI
jgi:hypothetical protein